MLSSNLFVKIWFGNDFQAFLSKNAPHVQKALAFARAPGPKTDGDLPMKLNLDLGVSQDNQVSTAQIREKTTFLRGTK